MSLVAICSVTGSPGVTTTCLALAACWPDSTGRGLVVVDADPSGSGFVPGYLRGAVPPAGGALRLAVRQGVLTAEVVLEHCVALDQRQQRLLLVGVMGALEARSLSTVWDGVVELVPDLDRLGLDVLVDAGRMEHVFEPTALLEHAGVAVVALPSSLAGVLGGLAGLERLRGLRGTVRVTAPLLIGQRQPYGETEVRRELGASGPVPVIAWDPRTAARLDGGADLASAGVGRTSLVRSASVAVESLRPAALDLAGGAR